MFIDIESLLKYSLNISGINLAGDIFCGCCVIHNNIVMTLHCKQGVTVS